MAEKEREEREKKRVNWDEGKGNSLDTQDLLHI